MEELNVSCAYKRQGGSGMTPIKLVLQQVLASKEKQKAMMIGLILTLTAITPLCGLLFQCGCDWPWSGLVSHCNYYQKHATHSCPWCASMITGVLSVGLAIGLSLGGAISRFIFLQRQHAMTEILLRVIFALILFALTATLTAALAANWQAYPLGIGHYYAY